MPGIRSLPWLALLGLACIVGACVPVTVNISFPQDRLDDAARQIENQVRSPENPKPAPDPTKPQSSLGDLLLAMLGPREAEAQGRTIVVAQEPRTDSPEIQRANAARSARVGQIDQWKARGCIGETNQGLLETRPGQGCGGEAASLVGAENADRQLIMDAFMRQNRMPASDTPRVREAFAKANREKARPGEWVQQPNGQWTRK